MTQRHHHDDDDDDDLIIRDGGRVRVPLHMMDGMDDVQRSIATHLHDGHGGGIGHKPGHIVSGACEALDVRRQMYDEYDARMATEYLGAGREGTICTVRNAQYPRAQGAPGHVQNGICVPDDDELRDALPARDSNMTLDALEAQHRRRMTAEYSAYDARIREMWRKA